MADEVMVVADEIGFTIRDLLQDVRSLVKQNRHRDAGEVMSHISILTQQMHAIERQPSWYNADTKVSIGIDGKQIAEAAANEERRK